MSNFHRASCFPGVPVSWHALWCSLGSVPTEALAPLVNDCAHLMLCAWKRIVVGWTLPCRLPLHHGNGLELYAFDSSPYKSRAEWRNMEVSRMSASYVLGGAFCVFALRSMTPPGRTPRCARYEAGTGKKAHLREKPTRRFAMTCTSGLGRAPRGSKVVSRGKISCLE